MADPFVAEIRIFPYTFAPRGWAFCDGALLPIAQNTALFSLIGTVYGGDGRTTVALPNLQGRAPMHPGQGPGLTNRRLGENGGVETVTLTEAQMPAHNHNLMAAPDPADLQAPASNRSLARSGGGLAYQDTAANLVSLSPQTLTAVGNNQPHNNIMPFLTFNFCIALIGLFPSRN